MAARYYAQTGKFRNKILQSLGSGEVAALLPRLKVHVITTEFILEASAEPVGTVYFLEHGVASMSVGLSDGSQIEVGLVGREGLVGLQALYGNGTSPIEGFASTPGFALSLTASDFRSAIAESAALRTKTFDYAGRFQAQLAQLSVCNNRHSIEQRLARWFLMMQEREDTQEFSVTQSALSTFLGVRRASITNAISVLERVGSLEHKRGFMYIKSLEKLELVACECYSALNIA